MENRKRILYAEHEISEREETDYTYMDLRDALDEGAGDWTDSDIIVSRSGSETHEKLQQEKFDAIILDIMMPVGNNPADLFNQVPAYEIGLRILEYLVTRKYNKNENTKISVVTGTAVRTVVDGIEKIAKANPESVQLFYKPVYIHNVIAHWYSKMK